jgi:hypothetical protein
MPARFRPARPADVDLLLALMRRFYAGERYPFEEHAARGALTELLEGRRLQPRLGACGPRRPALSVAEGSPSGDWVRDEREAGR